MNDSGNLPDLREKIKETALRLRALHRNLIDVTRDEYEQTNGAVRNSSELLGLLLNHPAFAWLHSLSQLMADMDELLECDVFHDTDAAAVRGEVEKLIAPADNVESEFFDRYRRALQNDPEVILAHADVRNAISTLPPSTEESDSVRRQWPVRNRKQRSN